VEGNDVKSRTAEVEEAHKSTEMFCPYFYTLMVYVVAP
jgi:hypothetical protein